MEHQYLYTAVKMLCSLIFSQKNLSEVQGCPILYTPFKLLTYRGKTTKEARYALYETVLLLMNPVKLVYGTIPVILYLKTKEKTIDNLIFYISVQNNCLLCI